MPGSFNPSNQDRSLKDNGSVVIARFDEVEVSYQTRKVLGPVNFTFSAGESLSIIGPSGCGKSTILRLLAGLETPSLGNINRHFQSKDVSFVFQSATLAPWMSGLDNVCLPLKIKGWDRKRAVDRARSELNRVGLADVMSLKPRQLSGGMAMRVSLARALVTDPKLLLMDEPFAALDDMTRRNLTKDVQTLWEQETVKPSLVFVTHNLEEAVYMSNHILILTPGPGVIAAEIKLQAPFPRPPDFRKSLTCLEALDKIESVLKSYSEHP